MTAPRFARYVAIGDSSTEGLDDPDGRGHYRGWADRLAAHLARALRAERHDGELLYANLAVRGRKTREILREQLGPALAMRPDIATAFSGTNDVIRKDFDLDAVRADVETTWRALRDSGATVVSFTLPDLSAVIPFAHRIMPRVHAMNEALRRDRGGDGNDPGGLLDQHAHLRSAPLERGPPARERARPRTHRRGPRPRARAPGRGRVVGHTTPARVASLGGAPSGVGTPLDPALFLALGVASRHRTVIR